MYRNGDAWYTLRKAVQKQLMHPRAGARYLPAQNAVADDFLAVLEQEINKDGYINDFISLITKYTMECKFYSYNKAQAYTMEHNL